MESMSKEISRFEASSKPIENDLQSKRQALETVQSRTTGNETSSLAVMQSMSKDMTRLEASSKQTENDLESKRRVLETVQSRTSENKTSSLAETWRTTWLYTGNGRQANQILRYKQLL